MVALKNPGMYASASAFAPVCNPSSGNCPWGDKAFGRYLGSGGSFASAPLLYSTLPPSFLPPFFSSPLLSSPLLSSSFSAPPSHHLLPLPPSPQPLLLAVAAGKEYDSTELAKAYAGPAIELLVDQGLNDSFYKSQLETNGEERAAAAVVAVALLLLPLFSLLLLVCCVLSTRLTLRLPITNKQTNKQTNEQTNEQTNDDKLPSIRRRRLRQRKDQRNCSSARGLRSLLLLHLHLHARPHQVSRGKAQLTLRIDMI